MAAQRLSVLYDAVAIGDDAPLTGVDNLVVSRSGDIFVAEDGGNLEIVIITPDGVVAPVMRLMGHDASEITGPAFSPDGRRLYFSSQRGTDGRGVTFEVSGPFRVQRTAEPVRGQQPVPASTASPSAPAPTGSAPQPAGEQLPATGASAVLAASAAAAALGGLAVRRAVQADDVSG